jgi:hypothetical protein
MRTSRFLAGEAVPQLESGTYVARAQRSHDREIERSQLQPYSAAAPSIL